MKGIVKPRELEIIDRYIQSGDRVFDVGARSGTWSVAVLLAKPGVELHAFEPASIDFRTLKQQLRNRWQGQVFLNNTALFNREDVQDAYSYEKKQARSIFHRWRKTKKLCGISLPWLMSVSTNTVDAYCRARNIAAINFMKIDTKGHEAAVIVGRGEAVGAGEYQLYPVRVWSHLQ